MGAEEILYGLSFPENGAGYPVAAVLDPEMARTLDE